MIVNINQFSDRLGEGKFKRIVEKTNKKRMSKNGKKVLNPHDHVSIFLHENYVIICLDDFQRQKEMKKIERELQEAEAVECRVKSRKLVCLFAV